MVRIDNKNESNKFKGYVYIQEEEKWELIGSTSLDDIYNKEEIDKQIEDCAKIDDNHNWKTTGSLDITGTTALRNNTNIQGNINLNKFIYV
ncbi:MAG: hypothetical protein LUD02_03410, partial [Tannerellaceae bacterium]|nr:hypothetical protein [Tannerellaceae bacterium]